MNHAIKGQDENKPVQQFKALLPKVVDALVYLKSTGRYKENELYRNSSFKEYLAREFNMQEDMLIELSNAYSERPKECERYGVGLVIKIQKQCGPVRGRKVWEEIFKADENLKNTITMTRIDEIIKIHNHPRR